MRPQQNRRMRGRSGGGNNRKSPNPLTRSYESNGPDVKIRGTAQQVAEKYTTLARDAQSSGDRVMAENYLQHAEHYNRLIAAAQVQNQQVRSREDEDEDRDAGQEPGFGDDQSRHDQDGGSGPQPVIEGTPAEVAHEQGQFDRAKSARAAGDKKTNGSGEQTASEAESAEDEEQPQRRPRRSRRSRAKAEDGEAETGPGGELAEATNS